MRLLKNIVMLLCLSVLSSMSAFAGKQCPDWKGINPRMGWRMSDPAINCRGQCNEAMDCQIIRDRCGRVATINKIYESEIMAILNQPIAISCERSLTVFETENLVCKNKMCQIEVGQCEPARIKYEYFLSERFQTSCKNDSQCSYIPNPSKTCMNYSAISIQTSFKDKELDLNYLKEKLIQSCGYKPNYPCLKQGVPQCFSGQCIYTPKKIQYVNYLNYEGKQYVPNLKSRTQPILMPPLNHVKCEKSEECVSLLGACSQYSVALNRAYKDDFIKLLGDFHKKTVCAQAPKINLPTADCYLGYCVYKK